MMAMLILAWGLPLLGPHVGTPTDNPQRSGHAVLTSSTGQSAGRVVAYVDGGRRVLARRLEDARTHDQPTPVDLHYPELDLRVRVAVGPWAIVALPTDETHARTVMEKLDLVAGELLMGALGLWRVRDLGGADGLSTVERLQPHINATAGPLTQAIPDLLLHHRFAGQRNTPPNDPRFGGQWYLDRIHIGDAWAIEDGEPSVGVVVVDNGCDLAHPELVGKLDPGLDPANGDDDPSYPGEVMGAEHGTACAGLIAAETDNGMGIAGACPGCRLRCVRIFATKDQQTPVSVDIRAFDFAFEVGASVVSNSWGFVEIFPVPQPLADAINAVADRGRGGLGAVVLFASGNEDREVQTWELLGVRGVVGVGAINTYDESTSFTNFGEPVDVTAPTGTLTTDISGPGGADPGDYTSSFGGTSSAAPVAAGVAGLIVSAAPEMTGAEITQALIETARPAPFAVPDDRGHDAVYGYGIVDPAGALRRVLDLPDPADLPDAAPPDASPPDATLDAEVDAEPDAGRVEIDAEPVDQSVGAEASDDDDAADDDPTGSDDAGSCSTQGPGHAGDRGLLVWLAVLSLTGLVRRRWRRGRKSNLDPRSDRERVPPRSGRDDRRLADTPVVASVIG